MDPGQRDKLITFQRGTAVEDDYTGEASLTWATLTTAWAAVRYGKGDERRNTAQEGGHQAATFGVDYNSLTASVTLKDRINFLGSSWDIVGAAPTQGNAMMVFTAVREA
jgi:head-tail adaptor